MFNVDFKLQTIIYMMLKPSYQNKGISSEGLPNNQVKDTQKTITRAKELSLKVSLINSLIN